MVCSQWETQKVGHAIVTMVMRHIPWGENPSTWFVKICGHMGVTLITCPGLALVLNYEQWTLWLRNNTLSIALRCTLQYVFCFDFWYIECSCEICYVSILVINSGVLSHLCFSHTTCDKRSRGYCHVTNFCHVTKATWLSRASRAEDGGIIV